MRSIAVVNHDYSGIIVRVVSQVQQFLESQRASGMTLEEQREGTEGCRQEAEDRPPGSAGEKEQMKHESVQEQNPEAGGDDSQDTDCSTCAQPQQEPEQPRRQLACLEIPDFLRSDAAEGSTGEVVKKHNQFGQS